MKMFAEINTVHHTLDEVCCNMCGRPIHKNEFGYFEDYISVEKTWDYHSPMDGETHIFDVCIDCYKDWIKQFRIPPRDTACECP